jgi:putative inorganic carbon (HCO3(-)) transporter
VPENALRRVVMLWAVAALAAASAGLGVMLATARAQGVALALVPVAIVAIGSLIASNRAVLIYAAFALSLLAPLPVSDPLPLHIGIQVYPSDILVLLAVASWVAGWLISSEEARPSVLRTHLLGWPLLLFGVTLFAAVIRGNERYGESLFSLPLRFLVYAGIAFAFTDLKPRDAYRWVVAVFYAGTLWQVGVAIYGYATGTSATRSVVLSTGGERVLAGSTAMFVAGALLLALLNLESQRSARGTALHLLMAALATFALISTFQRTTFAVASILVPISLLAFRRVGLRTAAFLPLVAPFLILFALLVPKVDQTFFPTFADRITASPSSDASATWRLKAYAAVWGQVRQSPLTGVGFGLPVTFVANDTRYDVGQDPHNQFLYLWAGGGLLLLGSFLLLLVVYLFEAWSRFRRATLEERRLIFWSVSLWFVFIVNSLTGIILTNPSLLLVFWILMMLPMTVRPRKGDLARPG